MTGSDNKERDKSEISSSPYFDITPILDDFSSQTQEATRQIHPLFLLPRPKIAFHGSDADGIVCAAILKASGVREFQTINSIYIPLNYQQIKHPQYSWYLARVNWVAVVDLPPIHDQNEDVLLYCDHHLTNKDLPMVAQLVLFDENAPSAAKLLADHYNDVLPSYVKTLAELTKITDTASFNTVPPVDIPSDIPSNSSSQAWLLHDLCDSVETPNDIVKLVDALEEQGLNSSLLEDYRGKLKKTRAIREKTLEIVEELELADAVLFILGKKKISMTTLVQGLFAKGVKLTCLFYPGKAFTGLSFRVNSQLSPLEVERIRVDKIARLFSGGGHPRAAGGRSTSFPNALKNVKSWVTQKGLSYSVYDIRDEDNNKEN
ncbi:MAG: bifunctional oligoribonuclease/PAP phosphatase NrnA [Candidatus Thorarchaeota archaeon]